jgi:hypothetical protein
VQTLNFYSVLENDTCISNTHINITKTKGPRGICNPEFTTFSIELKSKKKFRFIGNFYLGIQSSNRYETSPISLLAYEHREVPWIRDCYSFHNIPQGFRLVAIQNGIAASSALVSPPDSVIKMAAAGLRRTHRRTQLQWPVQRNRRR